MGTVKVAVTGSSGLIGTALVADLRADGCDVVRLVRRAAVADDEAGWDPVAGLVDTGSLDGCDAVVNLAGAGVGDHRWSAAHKQQILRSRLDATATISRAVAASDPPPPVLVSASAVGYYGDTGATSVDETGPKGTGFLADVVEAWERAADPAREAGVRVAHPRSGLVMARHGGAWGRMLPLFRLGLGGRLGSGTQYWPFITLVDEVRALRFLLSEPLVGPVNLTAPTPATNSQVTEAVGHALHRPVVLPVPAFALRAAFGELSSEVLGSARVLPAALTRAGFTWHHPDIGSAAASLR
jgi:uncharacterized protein